MKLISLVCALLFAQQSLAGYLIEPLFTQHSGSRSLEATPALGSTKVDSNLVGGAFGFRAGYLAQNWWLAVEFRNADATGDLNGTAAEFATSDLGLNVGARFSSGIRVYGSYLFDVKQAVTTTVSENTTTTTFLGSGIRLGVGYMFGNQITVNIDYTTHTFKKSTGENEIDDLSTVFSKYEYTPIHFSVGYAFGAKSK